MKTMLIIVLLFAVLLCGCQAGAPIDHNGSSIPKATSAQNDTDGNKGFPVIVIPGSSVTTGNTEAPTDSAPEQETAGADDPYDDGDAVPVTPQ